MSNYDDVWLADFLSRVDSLCSLVGHRGLDPESQAHLVTMSHEARTVLGFLTGSSQVRYTPRDEECEVCGHRYVCGFSTFFQGADGHPVAYRHQIDPGTLPPTRKT